MSRSRKKTPKHGHTLAPSDKPYKKFEHGRERSKIKQILNSTADFDGLSLPHKKEFGNDWSSPKDGKHYWEKPKDEGRIDSWKKCIRK